MKKYELTQEQIARLAENKHAKELLQKFIPEAFENELEVGKWYRLRNKAFNWLMCYTENGNGCYGFNSQNLYSNEYTMYDYHDWKLATEEEVREALINEAIKRGFKNVGELSLKLVSGEMFKKGSFNTVNNEFRYISVENRLNLDGVVIFYNGKWAEIVIEDIPTQEEIDRVINYLKNK